MSKHKSVAGVYASPRQHWVGDGFPVRNLFPSHPLWSEVSPFLLLDYAGPHRFSPTTGRRGVGAHPHRGFETVTILYQGEVEHRDSAGHAGRLGPGDVQWMTAASGIVHAEMHGKAFCRSGGVFQLVQLWVNLPRRYKMSPPRYQELAAAAIPSIKLSGGGQLRVIAGSQNAAQGPAQTFSPIELFDLELSAGEASTITLPPRHNAAVLVLDGSIRIPSHSRPIGEAELAVFSREGEEIALEAVTATRLLVLGGEPIDEPIVAHGPFVMSSEEEIRQAIDDYQSGRMGVLTEDFES